MSADIGAAEACGGALATGGTVGVSVAPQAVTKAASEPRNSARRVRQYVESLAGMVPISSSSGFHNAAKSRVRRLNRTASLRTLPPRQTGQMEKGRRRGCGAANGRWSRYGRSGKGAPREPSRPVDCLLRTIVIPHSWERQFTISNSVIIPKTLQYVGHPVKDAVGVVIIAAMDNQTAWRRLTNHAVRTTLRASPERCVNDSHPSP